MSEVEKRPIALRPPKPFFERVKLPVIIIAYVAASEWASPFPFSISFPARLAIFALAFLVLREFHHARLEVDESWVAKTARVEKRARLRAAVVSKQSWLKVQRVATWLLALYVFGMMVNALTTRCSSAIQCVILAPRLAVENLPMFIQFAVMVALTLFQLGIMFYAMVKVGSYKVVMPGTVNVTFDDVWGQDDAKQKVMEQVKLLEDSDHIEAAGGYMPKGLLLYGPPGTGKTYLAKAAANYSSKPLILVPPGAFQATFVGINLLKVWTLFREIRKLARRYGGVIVFIDEIDSLGSRGGDVLGAAPAECRAPGCVPFSRPAASDDTRSIVVGGGGGGMGTLEAFLSAMDGMEEPRGPLNRLLVFAGFKPMAPYEYKYLMIGATNMMDRLDPALLRAGRFGRKIHVTFPKVDGRRRTYEGYLRKVTNDLTPANIEWAARNHARGTGAEIQDIVNEALLVSFRDERDDPGIVRFYDLMHAMLWTRFGESDGPFEREEARWNVAVHEAGHAVAFHLLCRTRQHIWFASIERRGETGGMVAPTPLHEDWLMTRAELLADIQVSLASRVAEQLLIGTTTNGHGGDAASATQDAVRMVGYGLASQIGVYPADNRLVQKQAEGILAEALEACRTLLTAHKDDIEAVARLLYDEGTVTGDEIHNLLGGFES
jgi:ATP-dependent Zn protease